MCLFRQIGDNHTVFEGSRVQYYGCKAVTERATSYWWCHQSPIPEITVVVWIKHSNSSILSNNIACSSPIYKAHTPVVLVCLTCGVGCYVRDHVCMCVCVYTADICRVCRSEGTPDKPLYHPCVCTGSIKFIHQEWWVCWRSSQLCPPLSYFMKHVHVV